MEIVHSLFCADTDWSSCRSPLGERVSRAARDFRHFLLSAMLSAAGLGLYERGDVFTRVAAMRPDPPGTTVRTAFVTQLRALLAVPPQATSMLFETLGSAAFAVPWRDAFAEAGLRLGAACSAGTLSRGLRTVLAHVVIFHWNRLGLSAVRQAILARAAASACLPED